ncbi:hypothetical protein OH492_26715 [Vibrio chagasii]|nr:hypothetical protein [Vibrio chagasii]
MRRTYKQATGHGIHEYQHSESEDVLLVSRKHRLAPQIEQHPTATMKTGTASQSSLASIKLDVRLDQQPRAPRIVGSNPLCFDQQCLTPMAAKHRASSASELQNQWQFGHGGWAHRQHSGEGYNRFGMQRALTTLDALIVDGADKHRWSFVHSEKASLGRS